MSVDEKNCDTDRDILDEKLITYKRRRVYNENPNPQEGGASCSERKRNTKEKDIGWYHGKMLNGLKQHWQCNYCGMIRRGGGVTRLKLHLVGHTDVRKCPNVPDQVVEEITRHLNLKEKKRRFRNLKWVGKRQRRKIRRVGAACQVEEREEVDEMDSDGSGSESDESEKDPEDEMQHPSMDCMVDRDESTDYEVPKNRDENMHLSNIEYKADRCAGTKYESEKHAGTGNDAEESKNGDHWKSWKHVLESMLALLDQNENREGNGIEKTNQSGGVQCCIRQALSLPRADNSSQEVGARENSEKCRNALVSILKSDKFALLCDLLRNNFLDENSAGRNYFDFGEIDAKMKNGDYEKSPQLFYNDIMKIWKKFENIGQEMVRLATNLSSISRANIENQVGTDELGLGRSIDPNQARYCNHCRCEITNNWGLVSCKGCETSYHTSCINPLIHSTTASWYCSACLGKKPDVPINSGTDGTDSDKEGNSETVQPCITAMYRLCKICGVRADGEREFVVCSHPECPYKYYHTACLKKSRVGIKKKENNSTCWFCPSCLCRACRRNKDDPLLVLCDGCDHAYHTYCMDPPSDNVPEGKWYCVKCSTKKRRERGKKKNVVVPNIQGNNGSKNEYYKKEEHQSMDLLMTAIDTVSPQEK